MHSVTFVLLRPPIANLNRATIDAVIQRYRLNEMNYDPSWRYDYWTAGDGLIADAETAAAVGVAGDEDYAQNVCFVSRIGGRYTPFNIVTPDGTWHGLFDFGWKMMERETPAGQEAYERWSAHAAEVLAAYPDCIAVEIDTHS